MPSDGDKPPAESGDKSPHSIAPTVATPATRGWTGRAAGNRTAKAAVSRHVVISRVKTEEYNKGVSFRIPTIGFWTLCRAVEDVPGVAFTRKRKFFWSGLDVGAEFTFRGHNFVINIDEWDGALWIITQDGQPHPDEMQVLRDGVEQAAAKGGFLGSLWRQLVAATFT